MTEMETDYSITVHLHIQAKFAGMYLCRVHPRDFMVIVEFHYIGIVLSLQSAQLHSPPTRISRT